MRFSSSWRVHVHIKASGGRASLSQSFGAAHWLSVDSSRAMYYELPRSSTFGAMAAYGSSNPRDVEEEVTSFQMDQPSQPVVASGVHDNPECWSHSVAH